MLSDHSLVTSRKPYTEKDMMFIKIHRFLVDILVGLAPDVYNSHVTTEKKDVKQLLVQCQNALYGTMVASLL